MIISTVLLGDHNPALQIHGVDVVVLLRSTFPLLFDPPFLPRLRCSVAIGRLLTESLPEVGLGDAFASGENVIRPMAGLVLLGEDTPKIK